MIYADEMLAEMARMAAAHPDERWSAGHVAALCTEITRLREALRPFALAAGRFDAGGWSDNETAASVTPRHFNVGNLRAARRLLEAQPRVAPSPQEGEDLRWKSWSGSSRKR